MLETLDVRKVAIAIAVLSTLLTIALLPSQAQASGPRKVAVVMFKLQATDTLQVTPAEALDRVFTGSSSANQLFKDSSNNDTSLVGVENATGDVFGVYTLNESDASCGAVPSLAIKAKLLAVADGHDMSAYDQILYVFPGAMMECPGWAQIEFHQVFLADFRTTPQGVAHELGHAIGSVTEAHGDDCAVGTQVVALQPNQVCQPLGLLGGYGDAKDVMGTNARLFGGYNRVRIGALAGDKVSTAAGFGEFAVKALNNVEPPGTTQLLRIPIGGDEYYYIDFRRPLPPFDTDYSGWSASYDGVTIRRAGDVFDPWMWDAWVVYANPNSEGFNAQSETDIGYASIGRSFTQTLVRNRAFYDPVRDATLTTVSADSTQAVVRYQAGSPGAPSTVSITSGQLRFVAGAGQSNDVGVTLESGQYRVVDNGGPLTAGVGCTALSRSQVRCADSGVSSLDIKLGAGDDGFRSTAATPATIEDGAGDDIVAGGSGNDTIIAGPGNDSYTGTDGVNTLDYSARTEPLTIHAGNTLGGGPGENDRVIGFGTSGGNFTNIVLGGGDDTFEGCVLSNCVINGGDGDDNLDAGTNAATLNGGAGNDDLRVGGTTPNSVNGGDGNDSIDGVGNQPTADLLNGDAGDDVIASADQATDQLDCGSGSNHHLADGSDTVDLDCGTALTEADTRIIGGPAEGTAISSPNVEFVLAARPSIAAVFECSIDGGSWAICSSPNYLNGLSEGPHTYSVRAQFQSGGGIDSTPAVRNFTVDTVVPTVTIQSPGDGQQLTSGTDNLAFTPGSDVTGSTCSIDGQPATVCTSPRPFSLGDGAHAATVVVRDAAGNSASATRNFTIAQSIQTSITSGPSDGGYSTTAAVGFAFSSPTGGGTFECQTDGGTYLPCTSPANLNLSDGTHSFAVRAVAGGNPDTTPASRTFTVDTVVPSLSVQSPIEGQSITTNNLDVVYTGESGTAFNCAFDSDTPARCVSPTVVRPQSGGSHTFSVTAADAAGNTATVVRNVLVAAIPETSFTGGPADGATVHDPVLYRFGSTIAGSTFECRNGSNMNFNSCDAGGIAFTEGPRTFHVRAVAPNGMVDPTPASRTFIYDAVPIPTVTVPAEGQTFNGSSIHVNWKATLNSVDGPAALDVVSASCWVDSDQPFNCSTTPQLVGLSDGAHAFHVQVTDSTGNVSTATRIFNVDLPPDTSFTAGPINGGYVNTTLVSFSVASSEPNSTFESRSDSGVWIVSGMNNNVNFLPPSDGSHTIEARATDSTGNTDPTPATVSFTIDTSPPAVSIAAPVNGSSTPNVSPTLAISVTDATAHTEVCQVDTGSFAACPVTLGPLTVGPHTVTVQSTDAAGNIGSSVSAFTITQPLNPQILAKSLLTVPSGTHNLSTEGPYDWGHWGRTTSTSWDHKSGGSGISNVSTVLSGTTISRVSSSVTPTASWSGGTPTASSSGTATGITTGQAGVGRGVSFTVSGAQNTEAMTLKMYLGVIASSSTSVQQSGKLELFWSSDPGNIITDAGAFSTTSTTTAANRIYQITLRPPQASDTLNVRWTQNTSLARVRLYSATLNKVGATRAAAPSSANLTTDGSPATSLDWAHWGGAVVPTTASLTPIAKSGATMIPNATKEGTGTLSQATSSVNPVTTAYSWGNGDTAPSASNVLTGISSTGGATGRGFSFTVPADATNMRTLKLYVGATNSSATAAQPVKLELFWGTSRIPFYTDVVPSMASSTANFLYTINLRHATAGTNLKVKWSTNTSSSSHKATLQSAVLVQG